MLFYRLRRITQSITMILAGILVVATPIAMALIMKFLTITARIDYLYRVNLVMFWWAMVISRLSFAYLWYLIDDVVINRLKKGGWFWFAPSYAPSREKEPQVDKSGPIVAAVIIAALAFVITEVVIHAFTPETPPFWFWKPDLVARPIE